MIGRRKGTYGEAIRAGRGRRQGEVGRDKIHDPRRWMVRYNLKKTMPLVWRSLPLYEGLEKMSNAVVNLVMVSYCSAVPVHQPLVMHWV
ncbi:hypothetical protein BRADI_2g04651v3 [Brachypodium distachyon]|uniref:Uncharacterized protein n=1 Tax=Brachypodium distachyon TaxID=15368 RepID=A0A0Q3FXJ0_BRADI|nr:hypothetical protein BRADI_2g04651v3 [Brachypodium distachyon]